VASCKPDTRKPASAAVYIGKENNYQQFQKLRLEQRVASEQAQSSQLSEKAAQHEEMNPSFSLYDPMW